MTDLTSLIQRLPVRTLAVLDTLDADEMVDGYRDGFKGEPEPGNNRSLAYWHGWRNGAADKGLIPIDAAMCELASEVLRARKG